MISTKSIKITTPSLLETEIVNTGRAQMMKSDYSVTYRMKDYYSIHLYMYSATTKIGDNTFQIKPGDITITPANELLRYIIPEPGLHYFAHFKRSSITADTYTLLPLYLRPKENIQYATLFDSMSSLFKNSNDLNIFTANQTLKLILLNLSIEFQDMTDHKPSTAIVKKLKRAQEEIEAHYPTPVSTYELAKRIDLSPNYLAAQFKQYFGVTISQYTLNMQIDQAALLLYSTSLSIKEIGHTIGIPDPQYFNKRFRLVKGMSPTEFRTQ
jgi:AraC family transcriptional regulator, arabinose operon regulatory protein